MASEYEVVVVGAGAAGLMAAIQSGGRGNRTLLLEKNARPGLKILISGGGRCNLTTTKSGKSLEAEYGKRRGRWLLHALRAFQPGDLVELIESAGVPLREEDLDKIFPCSGKARDVLDCLLGLAEASAVELRCESAMESVERLPSGDGFQIHTTKGTVQAGSLILATGGLSYPKTGSTGDGYRIAEQFGHRIIPGVPHLAPLAVDAAWIHELAGIVLQKSSLAVINKATGEVLCQRQRPVLFTHKGLSGPAPMDLAGFIEETAGECELVLDFVPGVKREALETDWLQRSKTAGRNRVSSLLPRELPERLRQSLCEQAGVAFAPRGPKRALTVAELDKKGRHRLLAVLKDLRIPVTRSLGMDHAEVTRGGVALEEVDPRSMESRLCPKLFLCGEILDVDGPIGGFNFQAAFATGRLAGLHVRSQDK
ncbi:MAG: BaiN/RdsA family NAD(P)/FAD-dependent oxidoreductase [Planctomycetota bacterium]